MARPPRLPDATILNLIAELRAQHAVLTGTRLRAELARRHGTPSGVTRIYRLLDQAMQPHPARPPDPPPALPVEVAELQTELASALERARLAEHREQAHQDRWAGEIHRLREEARGFRDVSHRLRVLEQDVLDRSRELASAHLRIAELEARLR
jgi:enoyl-CoA hydratase/carnithine racemase